MNTDLIIISEYCDNSIAEPQFIKLLGIEGLIDVVEEDGLEYILSSQLSRLDRFSRWHYELSINIESIEVIQNLLDRIDSLQNEVKDLKHQLNFLDTIVSNDYRNL
ncbi:MAG: chaperone modulator CbpM [Dysgonomonas sp.]